MKTYYGLFDEEMPSKKIIGFSIIVALFLCCKNIYAIDTLNYVDKNNMKQGHWVYTNKTKKLPNYKDNQVIEEGSYSDDKKTGKWIFYYNNNKVKQVLTYLNNRPDGHAVFYYKNGNKEVVSEYTADYLNGKRSFYSPSGTLQLIRFYNHGILVGYSYLDENGEELPMIPVEKGTATIESYYPNGKLARKMVIKDGYFDEKYTSYYENGNLQTDIDYTMGSYNGPHKSYHENDIN